MPTLTATALTVDVRARTSPAGNVALTVLATRPLTSGTNTIAVSNLAWSGERRRIRGHRYVEYDDGAVGWHVDGPRRPLGYADLPAAEQLDMYAVGSYTTTLNYTLSVP